MKSKKKHTNQDFEVVDGIGKYMDDDIQRIIEGKQLELGDRELPPFDEYRIYKNIQEAVMREEKRKQVEQILEKAVEQAKAASISLEELGEMLSLLYED